MKKLLCILLIAGVLVLAIAQYAFAETKNDNVPTVYDISYDIIYEWEQ